MRVSCVSSIPLIKVIRIRFVLKWTLLLAPNSLFILISPNQFIDGNHITKEASAAENLVSFVP